MEGQPPAACGSAEICRFQLQAPPTRLTLRFACLREDELRLHGYFRSSAAYRVRIGLNLKGIKVEHAFRHLRKGEQRAEDYLALNPLGQVPTLETDDGAAITQSLAILLYLDETKPDPPLLPAKPLARARVMAFALAIAADIHPIQNLKILNRLRALGLDEAKVQGWAAMVIREGLAACERLIQAEPGPFCFGGAPTLADLCLVPQLFNARRFDVDLAPFPRLIAAEAACLALPAFLAASPELQADAE
jgi:maleylpyruvate isomerase